MTAASVHSLPGPYKGLAAFDDDDLDALFFFGRERETAVIAANVVASRFTVLYGPLGVGKSSLLRAGVVRRLREQAPDTTVVAYGSWAGDAPAGLLAVVADAAGLERPQAGTPLSDGLAELAGRSQGDLYLLLDQFEEVFAYRGAEALANELATIVSRPDVRIDVLLALREDALAELDVFTGRLPNVFANYLRLDRLDREAARAAVTGPITRYNELSGRSSVEIEERLVEAVLDQVEVGLVAVGGPNTSFPTGRGVGSIEAPYLQLVMERLWEHEGRRGSTVLRRDTLDSLGGAQAIVQAHLGEALEALAADERELAARAFSHLVTPSGTKIAHRAADLAEYAHVGEEELRPVLASLGDSRILRPVEGRFELYHDVLIDPVRSWRARHESERQLEQQRLAAERRQRRLTALLLSALVVLGAMAAVTAYALTQRAEAEAEARRAQASRLAAEASALIPAAQAELNPELALALAAEAAGLAPTDRSVNTLRRTLLLSHLRRVLPEEGVGASAFSQDGQQIAVGTEDGRVAVYADDARTRLHTLEVGGPLAGVSFSPDGAQILTAESGGPATVWDADTGASLRMLGDVPEAASFSPDGELVLSVEPLGARVWSAADGSLVAALRQGEPVGRASFSPDGTLVTTVAAGTIARVFDSRSGQQVVAVDHGDDLTSAAITPGSGQLVTAGQDGVARVWALDSDGRLVAELDGHNGSITDVVVSPDGTLLVTTGVDGMARIWGLPAGELMAEIAHPGRVAGAAFNADSSSMLSWGAGDSVRVSDARSGTAQAFLTGHGDAVKGASFDPSGDFVLTTGADGRARLWRSGVESGFVPIASFAASVSAAEFSTSGDVVATAEPGAVEVVDTDSAEVIARLAAPAASSLAVSNSGAVVAEARDGRVSVWHGGETAPTVVVEDGEPSAVALGQDGLLVAVGYEDGSVAVRSSEGGAVADLVGPSDRVTALALDAVSGSVIAGFRDGSLAAWSLDDGRRLYERRDAHRRGTAITSVAFSADGEQVVTAGLDATARVWEGQTGRLLYTLRGHSGAVDSAAFSRDGKWIVTTATALVGLWDTSTRQRLLWLRPDGHPKDAAFDESGTTILVVTSDGTLGEFVCEVCGGVDELLAVAERRLEATGRQLTPEERRHYLDDEGA